jgi:hypothetical protein
VTLYTINGVIPEKDKSAQLKMKPRYSNSIRTHYKMVHADINEELEKRSSLELKNICRIIGEVSRSSSETESERQRGTSHKPRPL